MEQEKLKKTFKKSPKTHVVRYIRVNHEIENNDLYLMIMKSFKSSGIKKCSAGKWY